MKKLIIIAVLFCLSAMTFKTEAEEINEIKDKEFLEFFKKFQKDLEESKGQMDYSYYIDYSAIKKQSKSVKDFVDNHFRAYFEFNSYVREYYELILKLSPLNKYDFPFDNYENGPEYDENSVLSWSLSKVKKNIYDLYFFDNGYEDDHRWGVGCTFAKTGDGWHIIDFYWL